MSVSIGNMAKAQIQVQPETLSVSYCYSNGDLVDLIHECPEHFAWACKTNLGPDCFTASEDDMFSWIALPYRIQQPDGQQVLQGVSCQAFFMLVMNVVCVTQCFLARNPHLNVESPDTVQEALAQVRRNGITTKMFEKETGEWLQTDTIDFTLKQYHGCFEACQYSYDYCS